MHPDAVAALERTRRDPVWFMREVLGHDPWSVPEQIAQALTTPRARVAVKSCHASSKSFTAADLTLWAVCCGAIVVTTAPTWQQVQNVLWQQIRKAYGDASPAIGGQLNLTELRLTDDAWAIGISTNEATRFQGFHASPGSFLLLIADEAAGVRPAIFEAAEGIRAGGDVRMLLIGNPTILSGPFYDAFRDPASGWTTFTIDGMDTPNLAGVTLADLRTWDETDSRLDDNTRPYLITRRYIWEKFREWGENHPMWHARVRGEFPPQAEDAVFPLTWLEWAKYAPSVDSGGTLRAGLDVAGPGDNETVLTIVSNGSIIDTKTWTEPDPFGHVLLALQPYVSRLQAVNVDGDGIGYHLALRLKDQGLPARIVRGSQAATNETYLNRRAELYWRLRTAFEQGSVSGLDDATMAQLLGIRYDLRNGKIAIESKDSMRARGVKSPDRADSLVYAYATDGDDLKLNRTPTFAAALQSQAPSYTKHWRNR